MTVFDFRPTLNAPYDDPYLWLEDVEGERTLAWAATQSARTLGHFGGTQFDRDPLEAILDRPDKVSRDHAPVSTSTISGKMPEIRALWRRDHPCRPPIRLETATRGRRVRPGHARKTAAKLQAFGYPAYF
ncbi:hypothetical protein [Mesorhizobium sp. M0643]|uniref:hypothetical protein n=1 Tax=Mesorhizobium sp. M0643 TaxID=2956978 RepID=UPI00333C4981